MASYPPNSIVSITSFEDLPTGIFAQCFPTIFGPFTAVPELKLSHLRTKIAQTARKVDLSPQTLCHLLTEEFCLEPYLLLTWQMGQALLETYMKTTSDALKHLDICLYYVECQRRIQRATSCVRKAILDQCSPKSAPRLASAFTLPDFSSWVASRLSKTSCCMAIALEFIMHSVVSRQRRRHRGDTVLCVQCTHRRKARQQGFDVRIQQHHP